VFLVNGCELPTIGSCLKRVQQEAELRKVYFA